MMMMMMMSFLRLWFSSLVPLPIWRSGQRFRTHQEPWSMFGAWLVGLFSWKFDCLPLKIYQSSLPTIIFFKGAMLNFGGGSFSGFLAQGWFFRFQPLPFPKFRSLSLKTCFGPTKPWPCWKPQGSRPNGASVFGETVGGVDRHGDEFLGDVKHFCQDYSIYTYVRYNYCVIYILIYDYILHISYDHCDFYTSYTVCYTIV